MNEVNIVPLPDTRTTRSDDGYDVANDGYEANGPAPAPYNPDLYPGNPLVNPSVLWIYNN